MSTGEKDVWSLDEVHFQQYGSRCRMWVPPETQDPILLHHPGRKSVGYFGAVRLRDGKFVSHRQTGRFNGESFYVFLKRLRRITARSPSPVVVLADNASYHHAKLHQPWREWCQPEICPGLPTDSPDLNPIERVWKLTRRTCVHNRAGRGHQCGRRTLLNLGGKSRYGDYAQLFKALCIAPDGNAPARAEPNKLLAIVPSVFLLGRELYFRNPAEWLGESHLFPR